MCLSRVPKGLQDSSYFGLSFILRPKKTLEVQDHLKRMVDDQPLIMVNFSYIKNRSFQKEILWTKAILIKSIQFSRIDPEVACFLRFSKRNTAPTHPTAVENHGCFTGVSSGSRYLERRCWGLQNSEPFPGYQGCGCGCHHQDHDSLRLFQHTPGTYPRPSANTLWRNSFRLGVWGGLGYAPGVCWGSLGDMFL